MPIVTICVNVADVRLELERAVSQKESASLFQVEMSRREFHIRIAGIEFSVRSNWDIRCSPISFIQLTERNCIRSHWDL